MRPGDLMAISDHLNLTAQWAQSRASDAELDEIIDKTARSIRQVLAAEGPPDNVIFHCFSSGPEMARRCVEAGWYISLSGSVSFRNARDLHAAVPLIPPELLLVETDAPFLTPHPYRGSGNEPYCLPYTVRALAHLLNRPASELAAESSANARRVYRIA